MDESELLFCEILDCDRMSLYQNRSLYLDKDKSSAISSVLKRRIFGEPIQYILGKTEFMGLEFKVSPDVFIPRPETEILVETVLKTVRKFASSQVRKLKILDIGTGSGCIAISLAKYLYECDITATDISEEVLAIAKENAKLNKVKINFIKSNLFARCPLPVALYDIIISNPPYIAASEIAGLQIEVRREPRIALDGGKDGLGFYRRIIGDSPQYLRKGGDLVLEIGFNQEKSIKNIFQKPKNFEIIEIVKDYNNIDRVIVAKRT